MNQFERDLFKRCFEQWGFEAQMMMLIEECSELIQATSKNLYRKHPAICLKERLDNFAEEMADTQLMIDEFIDYFNLQEPVKYYRMLKCKRLEKRLNETKNKEIKK